MTLAFLGDVWGFPLGTMLERLLLRDYGPHLEYEADGELREHRPENGHAGTALVILAAIIESHVRLAVHGRRGSTEAGADKVPEMLRGLLEALEHRDVAEDLTVAVQELFEVRNALLHSHEWSIDRGRWRTDRRSERPPEVVAERLVGRGRIPADNPDRMPRTGLNRILTWVDVEDVITALSLTVEVLDLLNQGGFRATVIVPLGGKNMGLTAAALASEGAVRGRRAQPQN